MIVMNYKARFQEIGDRFSFPSCKHSKHMLCLIYRSVKKPGTSSAGLSRVLDTIGKKRKIGTLVGLPLQTTLVGAFWVVFCLFD